MRVQSISNFFGQRNTAVKKAVTQPSFKGLVAPMECYQETNEESLYGGEYSVKSYTDVEKIKYYKFSDDSPEELRALKAKYVYYKKMSEISGDVEATRCDKRGEVEVIDVPVTFTTYKAYLDKKLPPCQQIAIESILTENNKFDPLLKRKEFTYQDALKLAIQEERAKRKAALNEAATRILESHKSKEIKLSNASELLK